MDRKKIRLFCVWFYGAVLLFLFILSLRKPEFALAAVAVETACAVLSIIYIWEAAKVALDFLEKHHYIPEEKRKYFRFRASAAMWELLEFVDENSKKQVRYSLLQKQAELAAMQSQIGPHFLYNTLESIRGLALEEQALQTTSVIEALSSMLRYSVSQNGNFSTVQKELDNLKDYTNILKYRLKMPFSVELDRSLDDAAVLSYIIPKLVFQPIVENAVSHGFEGSGKDNRIWISACCTNVHLIISIRDNGMGMDEEDLIACNRRLMESPEQIQNYQVDHGEKSVGLVNINQRIKLMFGQQYGINVYSIKNIGTEVRILLPALPSEESLRFYGDLP